MVASDVLISILLACGPRPTDNAFADSDWEPDPDRVVVNGSCAPAGESFLDSYSCDTIEGPTGDPGVPSTAKVEHNPETLGDPDYDWVLEQAAACSCSCCHSDGAQGQSIWNVQFSPAFTDSADDARLSALMGISGDNHGGLDGDENYGFERTRGSMPTQDIDRLVAFAERELERRTP